MYIDDLPIWAFIGRLDCLDPINADDPEYFLYNRYFFEVLYNEDQIIEINLHFEYHNHLDLTKVKETYMELLYSVKWKEIEVPFGERLQKYSGYPSLPHHLAAPGFSILNSTATLVLSIGRLLMYYMRAIKKDFYELSPNEESSNGQEERGWKYVCCDVFRYPHHKSLLAALIGTGTQLCTVAIFILLLGVLGVFYPYNRGNILVVLVILYAISSGVAGYVAVSFYCQLEGTNWVKNLMLTGNFSYGPLLFTFCFLNAIAGAYKTNADLSFHTITVVSSIWMLVALPMLALGGVIRRKFHAEFGAPCEVSKCPREITQLRWYRGAPVLMILAGILPFCVSYTEIHCVPARVWGHRIYTFYHVLVIAFILLLIATSLAAVALTHSQLLLKIINSGGGSWYMTAPASAGCRSQFFESHRGRPHYGLCKVLPLWWIKWFICLHLLLLLLLCVVKFFRLPANQFLFWYMACICSGFFLMPGAVGFSASLLYVCHIYSSIKGD